MPSRRTTTLLLATAAVAAASVFPLVWSFSDLPSSTQDLTCSAASAPSSSSTMLKKFLQPAVFVPHGGGPMPVLGDASHASMIKWLTNFQRDFITTKPDAIVLVTAHWEEDVTTISSGANPELFYDYYGFPDEAYEIKYPAPGSPALAARIQSLLADHSIPSKLDAKRGNDHGVFIPLKLMFPDADVPVVQMSLMNSLNPEAHMKVGEALRQLRTENVLLVGSGLSFHSFKYFFGDQKTGNRISLAFHDYLKQSLVETTDADVRRDRLTRWRADAPYSREVHPREEHLAPLFVIAGAGLEEPCEEIFADKVINIHTTGYLFGERS